MSVASPDELTDEQLAARRKTRGVRRAKATHVKKAVKKIDDEARKIGWLGSYDHVFNGDSLKIALHTEPWPDTSKWQEAGWTGSDKVTVSDESDGSEYSSSGVTWTDSTISFDPRYAPVVYTTSTSLDPEVIEILTGGGMKMPEPIEEVDLAVVCLRVRYFDSPTMYTFAATGVRSHVDETKMLWYVTGSDTPQGVSYDELLEWFTSNGREIVEMWIATSWKKLTTEQEENE